METLKEIVVTLGIVAGVGAVLGLEEQKISFSYAQFVGSY